MWSGMMTVLKTGAEITMQLSLGMMLSMDEILLEGESSGAFVRISLNKRSIRLRLTDYLQLRTTIGEKEENKTITKGKI